MSEISQTLPASLT